MSRDQINWIKATICNLIKAGICVSLYNIVTYFDPDLRHQVIRILAEVNVENDLLLGFDPGDVYYLHFQDDSSGGVKGSSIAESISEIHRRLLEITNKLGLPHYKTCKKWG